MNLYKWKELMEIIMVANEILVKNLTPVANETIVHNEPSHVIIVYNTFQPILYLDILVSIGNVILLLLLLYVYWGNYRKIKSSFTLGLIMFAGLLLLQNILFSSFLLLGPVFRANDLGIPIFFLNITEFLALFILLIVTWK